jgi:uncharacterized membrane protein
MEATEGITSTILNLIEYAALGIELLAVSIIILATMAGTVIFLYHVLNRTYTNKTYEQYKQRLGRALLLGLEILVAADIVRTVALEPSLTNVAILGLLVLIRTFLSWSLVVEIEHRWPWRKEVEPDEALEG